MAEKRKRKRRKTNYEILFISDNPKRPTKRIILPKALLNFLVTLLVLFVMSFVVFIAITNFRYTAGVEREKALQRSLEENEVLLGIANSTIESLTENNSILSETVNQKVEAEAELVEKSDPTGYPLSGTAEMEEKDEVLVMDGSEINRPMLEFVASDGTSIIATGAGVVTEVREEITYGYEVMVDHGNGYVTVYRSKSEPKVKVGDEVTRGGILYVMTKENDNDKDSVTLCYQILKDGEYIEPSSILVISG